MLLICYNMLEGLSLMVMMSDAGSDTRPPWVIILARIGVQLAVTPPLGICLTVKRKFPP